MQIREETPGDFDQIAALLDLAFGGTEESGLAAVVVFGDPEYYPRFGFSAAAARPLRAPFRGPAFMAMELVPGCLDGLTGTVRYAAAFGLDSEIS